jgi:hypothetical protein
LRQGLPSDSEDEDTVTMGPYVLNTRKKAAFAIGWAAGLQYKPEFAGPCVLTVIDTANSLNYFVADWEALKKDY